MEQQLALHALLIKMEIIPFILNFCVINTTAFPVKKSDKLLGKKSHFTSVLLET